MKTIDVVRNMFRIGILLIPFTSFIVLQSGLFPYITGKAFAFRVIITILAILWTYLIINDVRYRPKISIIFITIVIFMMSTGISTILSVNPALSFWGTYERMDGYINLLHLCLYFLIATSFFKINKGGDQFWYVFIVISVIMSIYGFLQIKNALDTLNNIPQIDGTFGNSTYLSVFLLMMFFITAMMWSENKISFKVFAIIGIFQLTALYFTGTRGALVGLVSGIITCLLLSSITNKSNKKIRYITAAFILLIFISGVLLYLYRDNSVVQQNYFLSRLTNILSNQGRLFVWPMAIDGFYVNPIFGWGMESFRYVFNTFYDPKMYQHEMWFDRAHNTQLDLLVSGGIFGLMAYSSIIISTIYVLFKNKKFNNVKKSIIAGLVAAYYIQNLFVFDNLISYILFFSILAYINANSNSDLDLLDGANIKFNKNISTVMIICVTIFSVFLIYYVNYKPYKASQFYVNGLGQIQKGGDPEKALILFNKALEINVFSQSELTERIASSAQDFFSPVVPESVRIDYFNMVDRAYKKKLLNYNEDSRDLLYYGKFLYFAGQIDESIEMYKKSIRLSPYKQATHFQLAAIYMDSGRYNEAVQVYERAFRANTNYVEARIMYGISLMYNNQNEKAEDILKIVPLEKLINNDHFVGVFIYRNDYNSLLRIYKHRYNVDPDNLNTNLALAKYFYISGNANQAIELLESYIEYNQKNYSIIEPLISEMKRGLNPF